uniref:Uncharacterized protein n=1 Tax=Sphaerodactylus townsendi TaxID=933632 RepID=A0ACB8FN73_9SAUR
MILYPSYIFKEKLNSPHINTAMSPFLSPYTSVLYSGTESGGSKMKKKGVIKLKAEDTDVYSHVRKHNEAKIKIEQFLSMQWRKDGLKSIITSATFTNSRACN